MSATFGVVTLPAGFTVPDGCVAKQAVKRESISNIKYRDAGGTTIRNIPGKLKTTEHTVELTGISPLSLLVPGEFVEGEPKVISVRNRETDDGVPESTVTLKAYETYPAP